jgi:hypothetical protein
MFSYREHTNGPWGSENFLAGEQQLASLYAVNYRFGKERCRRTGDLPMQITHGV